MILKNFIIFVTGLSFVLAYDDLSYQKGSSQSQTYSLGPIYDAKNAVDRDRETCTRTNPITIDERNPDRTVWWKVDLGGVYNIYSISIMFKNYGDENVNRQRGRFAGFSLYVSNSDVITIEDIKASTLCYKDGPELPLLNFTTTCTELGRYVIFYNERLLGATYPKGYELKNVFTELCEVIVNGCSQSGFYGLECNITCPITCKDKICHIQNGTCFECERGSYDDSCDKECPMNCKGNKCHIANGTCFSCEPGWTGNSCNTKCTEERYGVNCSQECSGHCRDGVSCNYVTGQCTNGCDVGWTGSHCDKVCDNGTYGYNCVNNCSGHCLNNTPCNKQTGQCDGGCNPGYIKNDCSKECAFGYFGMDCRERCSGHCENNKPCDHVSGVCSGGCEDGYIENNCNRSCDAGKYGKNCALQCSLNCNGTCGHEDGSCKYCKAGWKGYNCSKECVLSFSYNCQYQCSEHCINKSCDRFNGSCLHGCMKDRTCALVIDTTSSALLFTSLNNIPGTVGGVVGGCVALIVGVVMTVIVLRLKRKAKMMTKRESIVLEVKHPTGTRHSQIVDNRPHDDYAKNMVDSTYTLPERSKRGPPTNKNIPIRNIRAHIANMSANENTGFKSEYHDIPRGELHPCTEGKKPENKVKNRYITIFPYDHSRIVLASDRSGYINANYIEDTQGKRFYIATQGPKPKTIADFWTMIWQEEVCTIVCLTNLTEGTKNKCAQYWPDINDKLQGGTLNIRNLEEKTYAEYIIRRFKIHNKSTRRDRHVTMFHYTTWSDHGVADPLSLVVFHRHVIKATANSAGKYTVVHCSAGVGRTGTYIALDALYMEGERTGKINVPMYVRTMRKGRMNMIQGDDQYKLLYLALKDAFYGYNKCLETEKFLSEYQEQNCYTNCGDISQKKSLSSDIEELLSLRKEYTQQDYISGRAQISANYTESVLPVEEFMCHLYYMKGYNTYYNAVLIQSYLEKDSLISAQYPLPDNTEDFLRLIKDFDARVVVFLCPLEDIESTSKWFPPESQHKFNGIFYVKNMSSTRSKNIKITRLNIQPTGFNEMDITLLECPTWGERQKKGDKRVLLDVIKAVKTEKSDQKGRVLVLSSDGATRCGPFFVVYNVLEQISVDREVDIFTAVRQIQLRRPECVSTVEEYKLCHETVAEYLLNDCVYGNC